jgi:hypothetical protein
MTRARIHHWLAGLISLTLLAIWPPGARGDTAEKALAQAEAMWREGFRYEATQAEAFEPALRMLYEIAARYPPSAATAEALCEIGYLAGRLGRHEEAIAAYERVIEECPGCGYSGCSWAANALACLNTTTTFYLKAPERWQSELERMTEVLREALRRQSSIAARCNVLWALVRAADFAGDVERACGYCREIIKIGDPRGDSQGAVRDAREYLAAVGSPTRLDVSERRSLYHKTASPDLTPEIEVERELGCGVTIIAQVPTGQVFPSRLTMTSARPIQEAKPAALIEKWRDGTGRAVWEGRHVGEGLLERTSEWATLTWSDKTSVDDVKVWRSAEPSGPGRQRVSLVVDSSRPCVVCVDWAGGATIDVESARQPPNPPADDCSVRCLYWCRDPAKPRSMDPTLDCSGGRLFSFEMALPEGVKRVLPAVTVIVRHTEFPVSAREDDEIAAVSSLKGKIGDVDYLLESPTPFRVTRRAVYDVVTYRLLPIVARE